MSDPKDYGKTLDTQVWDAPAESGLVEELERGIGSEEFIPYCEKLMERAAARIRELENQDLCSACRKHQERMKDHD